jgi:methionyl-tRNA formyltransferase
MKIIFFGTPKFAVPTLQKLLANPHFEVLAIVTQPDKRRGRGNQMMPSEVKKIALEYDLPVWQPKSIKKNKDTLNKLKQAEADVFVVVAYGQILSPEILEMPRLGCINVHGSILPQYRGPAPIQWSIYHGDPETGITTMLMDQGMDTGDMLLTVKTPINLLTNAHQLAEILADQGADLLIETLLKLEKQELNPIPQDHQQATYASLIQKSDYSLDLSRSAFELHNQIRAFYPNCILQYKDKELKILSSAPLGDEYWSKLPTQMQKLQAQWSTLNSLTGIPGEVVYLAKKLGFVIQTGSGLLLITEVQPSGKRPQSGWDFVNGNRLTVGEILAIPDNKK